MKFFALIEAGRVKETFPEFQLMGEGADAINVPIADRFHPEFVAGLVEIPAGQEVVIGGTYEGGVFGPVPPPPAVTAPEALAQRDGLLAIATARIAPLQDAVDLDQATAAEIALLKKWKQYRVALNRIQDQAGFPASVDWPIAPV